MLSRKLLGCVAVGVLSVALVPVSWARTHSHMPAKAGTPIKHVVTQSTKTKPVTLTAPKTTLRVVTHKVIAKKPVSHKLMSHRSIHSKLGSKKLVSRKTTTSKLTVKRPVSRKLVKKTFAK